MSLSQQVKIELQGRLGKSMEDVRRAQSLLEQAMPVLQEAANHTSRIPAMTADLVNSEVQDTIAKAEILKEQIENYKLERDEIRRKNQDILISAAQVQQELKTSEKENAELRLQLKDAEARLEAAELEPLLSVNTDEEEKENE